jgi:Plasmid encoded RepA protein
VGTVHQLIERVGRQEALKWAETDADRRAIEAAIHYMADEELGVGFLYSGWCQAALPHKRLLNDQVWKIETERVALVVEPGRRNIPGGSTEWVGVPYGSRARLILLYLQTEALRTNSRDIELGRSLHAWLGRLGIPIGGKSFRDVREQAERLSRCRLTFHIQQGGRAGLVNQNIVDTAMFVHDVAVAGQGSLFVETARLSETFFEQLRKHPVPLEEAAIRAISNNSQALDLYCWLAYRLHSLSAPRHVTWKALFAQFGSSYRRLDHFKERFIDALKIATAVYRDADVEVDQRGVLLRPSRPPIAPRVLSLARPARVQGGQESPRVAGDGLPARVPTSSASSAF